MADNFRRDFETVEEYHARLDREAAERATFEPDLGKVLEQTPKPKPEVIVKPGNYYARLALKDGNEDEYSNRMKARYGGEW
jgi:hypothetical protein